jgi:urease accessory protein
VSTAELAESVSGEVPPDVPVRNSWRGELELWFAVQDGATRLMRRRHLGPLVVQRAFHPEADGTAHLYILHPPGGVAGGDRLQVEAHVAAGARALMTTPGAAKFYRSADHLARSNVTIDVGPGGVCEYLPQETIVFDGAHAAIRTRVDLAADAVYAGWDFICLGRPAAGETFARGAVAQHMELRRDGRPIWFERLAMTGGSPLLGAAFAMAGQPITGTMVYAGPIGEGVVERIRAATGDGAARRVFSVSALEHVIVCRYLGASMSEGKSLFARAWVVLREVSMGKRAVPPRIWST